MKEPKSPMYWQTLKTTRHVIGILFALFIGGMTGLSRADPTILPGHVPTQAMAKARHLGRLDASKNLALSVALPIRNADELKALLHSLTDPSDPQYGHYLSSEEFTDRYAPTQADYDQIAEHFALRGFTVSARHPNRLLLDLEGASGTWESALGVQLHRYRDKAGREFHAPDREPQMPVDLASRILHFAGLNDAVRRHGHWRKPGLSAQATALPHVNFGPSAGLTPADIARAYEFSGTGGGAKQTLGLLELAGYNPTDISSYQSYFGLPAFTVQPVQVTTGIVNSRRTADSEVTLDIELQMALAPGDSTILVYQAPNRDSAFLDILNRMATDNLAKQISISWGSCEASSSTSYLQSENQIFQQMAAQGQTVFAAAGDSGAYDCGTSQLSVDDPSSQPYVVGVGGTTLSLASDGGYLDESTWNAGSVALGAGGGGVSAVWPLPDYQKGVSGLASTTHRNVPDVALNADPDTGYAIFLGGTWQVFGGTSAAAPLWAALIAHLNQQRAGYGLAPVGSFNDVLYQAPKLDRTASDFHDIADNSSNLHYLAKAGYDNATGWGSFRADSLLADLLSISDSAGAPPVPSNLKASGGDGMVSLTWSKSTSATGYDIFRSTSPGNEGATPLNPTPVTTTGYQDAGLSNGQVYYYTVRALNAQGISAMSGEVSATPLAAATLHSISVNIKGQGRVISTPRAIRCGKLCEAQVAVGTQLTLKAVPAAGQGFAAWSGDCAGPNPCMLTINGALSVTAEFLPKYALRVAKRGHGTVTASDGSLNCGPRCLVRLLQDTQITLTASPAVGYVFAHWEGACQGTKTCAITVQTAHRVVAVFTKL